MSAGAFYTGLEPLAGVPEGPDAAPDPRGGRAAPEPLPFEGLPAGPIVALAEPGDGADEPTRLPLTTVYRILDLRGLVVAEHVRRDAPGTGKRLWWRLPDGTRGLAGRPLEGLPLYRCETLARRPADPVYLTEGEKAADALARAGLLALGTVTGAAGTPGPVALEALRGRAVRLWPDHDEVGERHMERIELALREVAASVAVVEWADAPEHGDAADFLVDGRGAAEVLALPLVHSSGADVPSGGMNALPFRTAREFVATLPESPRWALFGYVPFGCLVELVGKAKAAGKTTWLLYLVAALVNRAPFLGHATSGGPVVFLTEQPGASLRAALHRTGLANRADLSILSWRDARGTPWPDVVAAAFAECRRIGAVLLVIDTLPAFAGIRGDAENDAGAALEAIAPVQEGMSDDLAVIVVRHERKMGGEVGDSARGSSAFTGAVDVVLRLARKVDAQRPTIRTLTALSRFDETPPELVIELTDAGYVALGDEVAIALSEARGAVLDALEGGEALTRVQLEAAAMAASGAKPTTVQTAVAELLSGGAIARSGAGHKGNPYRYALSSGGLLEGLEETPPSTGDPPSPGSSERFLRPYGVGASEERIFGAPGEVPAAVQAAVDIFGEDIA